MKRGIYMRIAISIIIFIIIGIILAKIARLIGFKVFKFSEIYKSLFKHSKD